MRILVTGDIGGRLVPRLLDRGHEERADREGSRPVRVAVGRRPET